MKKREFLGIIVIFTLLRIAAFSVMGLMTQDAYYSYYADNLALSYYDHPPMVAYMISLFFSIFGKSVFVLHMADFVVTSGTLTFLYLFLRNILQGDQLKKAFLLVFTAPFITILSINTTPDVPLLFFWSLGLLLGYYAITRGDWKYWLSAGFVAGCAFTSKYTGLFLPAGLFLFMLLSREHRKNIISWKFVSYAVMTLLAMSPVIIWNIQHDFISFLYQSSQRASDVAEFNFDYTLFFGYLGSQLALALPLLFLLLYRSVYTIGDHRRFGQLSEGIRYAASFALPMFLLFTTVALFYWVKINWIMPVYLSGSVLAAMYLKGWKWLRVQTIFSIVLHIVGIVELTLMPISIKSEDTWWGWDKLAQNIEVVAKENPDAFIFSDDSYKTSAALNFYLDQHIYAGNIIGAPAFQFALNDKDLEHLKGQTAIYVSTYRRHNPTPEGKQLEKYFEQIKQLPSVVLKNRKGQVERSFFVYECTGYDPTGSYDKKRLNIGEKSE